MGFVCLGGIKVKAYEFNNTKIYGEWKRCEKFHNKVDWSRGIKTSELKIMKEIKK